MRQDGGDVGGEEGLVLTQAHHHAARPVLGRHEAVGGVLRQHHDGVRTAQLAERPAHRLVEARRVRQMPLDQVGDHLGVGVGGEAMPLGLQALLDGEVVLDDPVVHDDEAARAVGMGMRVLVGGAPVSGPPRVADADIPPQRALAQEPLQHLDPAGGAPDLEAVRAHHRDARRIIAAVLELLEPFDDDVDRALVSDIPHDSAHGVVTPRVWVSGFSACAPPSPL
jgi:hypothetical protein